MQLDRATDLWSLFISAFVSSTIAPGGSEVVLGWLVSKGIEPVILLVLVATIGNTLGALTTWFLGVAARKGFRRGKSSLANNRAAIQRVEQWGVPALLFSWLPVVGDALCFAGGWLRLPIFLSVAAITIGKFFRYLSVAYLVS